MAAKKNTRGFHYWLHGTAKSVSHGLNSHAESRGGFSQFLGTEILLDLELWFECRHSGLSVGLS